MQTDQPADFVSCVVESRPRLRGLAIELTRDPFEADDIVAEVLLRAWSRWDRLTSIGNIHAYLRRMVVNEFISRYRRRRRLVLVDTLDDFLAPAPDHAPDHEDRAMFGSHLAALPPRQRASVYLRYYADSSDRQIAAILDCSEVTVRSNISRAMRTLRAAVGAPAA